jgi:hypothetical protein
MTFFKALFEKIFSSDHSIFLLSITHRFAGSFCLTPPLPSSLRKAPFLNNPPRPGAIYFVVARPLIHDVWPFFIPNRRIFIIQPNHAFRNGRERAEGSSSRKTQNQIGLPWILVHRSRLLLLNKIPWNFNNRFVLFGHLQSASLHFRSEPQLDVKKLATHIL